MSKSSKTYNHPALARLLKQKGACETDAASAIAYASRHPTLAAAVKAARGSSGFDRIDWLAFHVGGPEKYQAEVGGWAAQGPRGRRAARRLALAVAERIDRAVSRTRRAAKTRAANRAGVA